MTLAQWIRLHRLNQSRAAAYFGVSRPLMSNWLRGTIPRPEHLRAIYRKTGGAVSPNDFYGLERKSKPGTPESADVC
jgi:DNA-binding transcriptional regulator YdaS (Cro superfamily)